jgi:Zn-dependent protease/predicted transcriptional regulator
MNATIKLGRWFGVPIGLHYSWFIVAALITVSLISAFTRQYPTWTPLVIWPTAILTAVLFFVCIVLHELAHAAVARLGGLTVNGITLFALGGVAQIAKEATSPGWEFSIAIVGPIASAVIATMCQLTAYGLGWTGEGTGASPIAAMLVWLGYVNIALAIFNMIPGFPLDGGRVLRAIIWAVVGSAERATKIASAVGQVIALVFIALGLAGVMRRGDVGGLWLAFIGWFLLEAARSNYVAVEMRSRLRGVRVADLMTRDCALVDANVTVQDFVNGHLLRGLAPCFVVHQHGDPIGLVTAQDVERMPATSRAHVMVSEIVHRLDQSPSVEPDTPATTALELMSREHVNELPVVEHGHFEGIVVQSNILRRLQLQQALKA